MRGLHGSQIIGTVAERPEKLDVSSTKHIFASTQGASRSSLRGGQTRRAGDNMNLSDYNNSWKTFLESEKCPPVLGLAPLSDAEADGIRTLVNAQLPTEPGQRFNRLLSLLKHYPAVMTVWLARVAGQAYDGNFWENFERLVGVKIQIPARSEFVKTFRQCCFLVGITTLDPPQMGVFIHMERLLFQAGLPLCHVEHFANSMRWVERQFSLPDPNLADAGQDLRALMIQSPNLTNVPFLRKALTGPAGPLICEAALRVALDAEPLEINPTIAQAVQGAFEDVGHGMTERPRAPFLRLAADFCSLEVVCPKQPASLVGATGLIWVVGGMPQRVGVNDETVFPVSSQGHFTVELRGLAGGHNLRREFDLRWAELNQPFLAFDSASRCWHRVEEGEVIAMRSGQYWVLHSVESQFDAAARRWDWPDGQSSLSEIMLRPGHELRLSANEKNFVFKAAQVPFFAPNGKTVCTDELERLHYGWSNLPEVWCPVEDDAGTSADWKLHVHYGDQERVIPLTNSEHSGNMMRYQPNGGEVLKSLTPGLHFVQLSVSRGSRRPQCKETFKLWVGLREYHEGVGFDCDWVPFNIRWSACSGLLLDGMTLKHSNDNRRQHVLAFEVGEEIVTFRFSRSGTFLESFEKRAGHAIHPEACRLGDSFSASIQSKRFLRIWHIPADDYKILVNGIVVQEISRASGRFFCDISLADLSTRFLTGGEITVSLHGNSFRVAKFTKPLVPRFADTQSDEDYESLVFKFAEAVSWVRPKIRELVSGRVVEFEGQRFSSSGHCTFMSEGLPKLECANVSANINAEGELYRVSLDVPKDGWPEGSIWLMELEIRHDESSAWQLLSDKLGGGFPLVLVFPPTTAPVGLRAMAYWWAFGQGLAGGLIPNALPLTNDIESALCELLSEVSTLLSRGFNERVWQRLKGLERLFFELGRITAKRLDYSEVICRDLLQAVAKESISNPARSLFVNIPELLTQTGAAYACMPGTDGLRDGLRWCARVRSQPRVADAFLDVIQQVFGNPAAIPPGIFGILQNFDNFAQVMQTAGGQSGAQDFSHFNFHRYRTQIIGAIKDEHTESGSFEPLPLDRLCRGHAIHALTMLRQRRQSEDGHNGNVANAIFATALDLRNSLHTRLNIHVSFIPEQAWNAPWLDVDLASDALASNLNCYASMAALAARASAAGWMRYSEFLGWQTAQFGLDTSMKATTTLVAMSPELFGFYLFLWELLIRTEPHD
jgi:hypothetical protein